jgi:hypothetical protein
MMRPRGRAETLRVVTHQPAEPAAAGHAPPAVAVLAAVLLMLTVLAPLVIILRASGASRRKLGSCPLCASRAIRDSGSETLSFIEARIWLQCGQCGTWRQFVANIADQQAHQRRIKRDLRRIRNQMLRLETERRWLDMQAFIALLRSEIVGAGDFLAWTRPRARERWRRQWPRGDR